MIERVRAALSDSALRACVACMSVLWLACGSTTPTAAVERRSGAEASSLGLYVLDCGTIRDLVADVFLPGDADAPAALDLVNRCYLIEHPNGTLLWDTGLPDFLSSWFMRTLAWVVSFGALDVRVDRTLEAQLAELGRTPEDIDYLAFSHLHTDHVGNANRFTRSTWLIQRPELEAAFAPDSEIFDSSYYARIRENPRKVLDGDFDVFGDGRVVILSAPGHTPGHQCLFLDLSETGPIVLSGDLYHTQRSRELRLPPTFNTDRDQSRASMDRIESFLKERGATLWIQHDPASNAGVPLSPERIR